MDYYSGIPDSRLRKDKYLNYWEVLAYKSYQRLIETLPAIHLV